MSNLFIYFYYRNKFQLLSIMEQKFSSYIGFLFAYSFFREDCSHSFALLIASFKKFFWKRVLYLCSKLLLSSELQFTQENVVLEECMVSTLVFFSVS